jgi:uncharacterized membrane protein YkvA (DUF1232 family)
MALRLRDALSYFRDQQVPMLHKLPAVLALLYAFSPIDLIPDALPLVGWLDDVGVLAAVATWYVAKIAAHRQQPPQDAAT